MTDYIDDMRKAAKVLDLAPAEGEEKKPLIIQLFKNSTSRDVSTLIIKAEDMFVKDKVSTIQIVVKGYENNELHPALINSAKKKYIQAIEGGLLGFLIRHGYYDISQATYGMAYCRAKIVDGNLRFSKFDDKKYLNCAKKSIEEFNRIFPNLPRLGINPEGKIINSAV